LSQLPQLNVKARSSVFRYKGKGTDAATIGRELNVQAILNGRVVQRGDGLTLYLELVDAQTGNRIWGDQYIRKQTDIISLQNEIARTVVDKLKVKLSRADEQKLAKNYTENVEAHELFLRGRFQWRKLTQPDIEKGIVYLQQAVDADPSYALAYAGIAEAYRALAVAGELPPGEIWPNAKAAAQKAVEIDDDLAEGHSGLGSAFFFNDWNWAEAENQFLRALELDPNSSMAHFCYADFLSRMGRGEEGRAHLKRAREIEPLSPFLNAFEAASLPEPDEAMERVRIAIDLDPNFYFAHMIAAVIYKRKQMYPESIAESRLAKELSPNQTWSDVGLVGTLVQTGKLDEARAIRDEMLKLSKSRFVPPFNIALVYNALGETDQALAWLEKGYEQRDPRMTFLKTDGRLKNLREDPRFQDLMRRVGF
jgi:tetratricopeptide (TPR) repeat protein